MKRKFHIHYLLPTWLMLVLFCSFPTNAQEQKPVNLNQKNGLPTDFLYDMVADKYGYLWMATPRGVVKYNGYQTKTFGFSAGLPNEDIWSVFADKYGRVFCATHANEIGYVQNDRFTLLKNDGFTDALFPGQIRQYKNGIAWWDVNKFYFEKKGILYQKKFDAGFYGNLYNNESAFLINKNFYIERILHPDSLPQINVLRGPVDTYPFHELEVIRSSFRMDYLMLLPPSDTLWIINKDSSYSRSYGHLLGGQAKALSLIERNEKLYIKFDKGFVLLDSNYKVVSTFRFDKKWCGDMDGNTIPITWYDPLWDTCIVTNKQGLFRLTDSKVNFIKVADTMKGYQFIKDIGKNAAIWWNATKHKCIVVRDAKIVDELDVDRHANVRTAVTVNDSAVFIFTTGIAGYWYYPYRSRFVKANYNVGYITSAAADPVSQQLYFLKGSGLLRSPMNDQFINGFTTLAAGRYNEVLYDQYYKLIVVYNYSKILLIKNGKIYTLDRKLLNWFGIGYIERIRTDEKGNLFIKDHKKVVCINIERFFYKTLVTHANFSDAQMSLHNDLLVLAGGFGFSFYKIDNSLSLKHCIYRNVKGVYYNHLYDVQVNSKNLLFSTDEGCYVTAIPSDTQFISGTEDDVKYRFLIKYGDNIRVANAGIKDTIRINQDNLMLDLDIVNPSGFGAINYSYTTGQERKAIAGSQLFLNQLTPDRFYQVSVLVGDDAWMSGENKFVVYIIPFWWQTGYGKIIIAAGFVLFILALVFAVFLLTKGVVRKRNERNQLRMDIELKSIYSQINPHFIFNTISGTQYFIRENKNHEARLHLNKFSRLLRSYIQSSRNKYISIKDELTNLVNYIELQQIRFVDKFDYLLIVAEDLEIDSIKIPSLLLQPIVENAINHGLFHVEGYKGLLRLEFYKDANTEEIVCVIDDNGVGRKRAKEIKAESIIKTQSYGDALIRDLIEIFNKYEKLNIRIEYVDKEGAQTGTTVLIKIKNPVYEK